MQWLTPVGYIVGATLLLTGNLITPVYNYFTPNPTEESRKIEHPELPDDTKKRLKELEELFKRLGWSMIGFGGLSSSLNNFYAARSSQQPSWSVGAAANVAPNIMMFFAPSVATAAALYVCLGFMFSGYANKIQNKHLKEGQSVRKFDIGRLNGILKGNIDKKAWSELMTFLKEDQLQVLKAPVSFYNRIKEHGIKNALFEASPEQSQLSSLLMYAGGIPLMLMGGDAGILTNALSQLQTAGVSMGYLSIFSDGIKTWDYPHGKAVAIAIPIQFLVQNAFTLGDIGVAAERGAMASVAVYEIREQGLDEERLRQHSA